MKRPIIRIHDLKTNEIVDREMNDVEFDDYTKELEKQALKEAELAAQAEAKASLLNRLGITESEAKLLLS